jgi:DNA-binding Lrp family transcriptional regulator
VVTLKELELKLISELMKNSRRSDRELAKSIGVSQPTVSRLIKKLENQGVIKEYTMIPDFPKLGFNMLSLIMLKLNPIPDEGIQELHRAARELDNQERRPYLMIMDGMGLGNDVAILTFHKNYGEYAAHINSIRDSAHSRMKAFMDVQETEGFLIDLNYMNHYQPITFSKMATNLQTKEKETLSQSTFESEEKASPP